MLVSSGLSSHPVESDGLGAGDALLISSSAGVQVSLQNVPSAVGARSPPERDGASSVAIGVVCRADQPG